MKLHLSLFAMARDLCGTDLLEFEMADGRTIADLRTALAHEMPGLTPLLASSMFAVAAEYVPDEFTLKEGDKVACIPPVSGG
jgi:molybdopterin converting factor subunit 1